MDIVGGSIVTIVIAAGHGGVRNVDSGGLLVGTMLKILLLWGQKQGLDDASVDLGLGELGLVDGGAVHLVLG